MEAFHLSLSAQEYILGATLGVLTVCKGIKEKTREKMMTFEDFQKTSKKKEATVQKWIKDGLVNGAVLKDGKYVISDLARPPYTRGSSKNAASIRKGIVVGCKRRLSVNAKVFNIPEYEFSVYVNQVKAAGLIEQHVVNGNTYYYSTPKADGLTDNQIYKIVRDLTGVVAEKTVEATIEKMVSMA